MQSIERGKTSIPRFERTNDPMGIWLNSFLSIFIPSCPLDLIDPALVHFYHDKEIDLIEKGERKKILGKQIHDDSTKFNKLFQLKVIRRQIVSSSLIILLTVTIICSLVNFNEDWKYKNNILTNKEFNTLTAVLVVMSFISFLFIKNMDIFELFNLNSDSRRNTPLVKGSVLAAATLLVLR